MSDTLGQQAGSPYNPEFFKAFMSSLAMIIVSEIGDKTFFIAAILAMKQYWTPSSCSSFCCAPGLNLRCITLLFVVLGFRSSLEPLLLWPS